MQPPQPDPSPSPHTSNPYAAPRGEFEPGPPHGHAPGRALTWVYAAALASQFVMVMVAHFGRPIGYVVAQMPPVACFVAHLAWLYAAWQGIPRHFRGTLSPRRAVLPLLIPLYQAYWSFAVNLALCDTLNGILERASSDRRAPRTLGIVVNLVQLTLAVVWLARYAHGSNRFALLLASQATSALWLVYLILCDEAREAVARLGDRAATPGALRLSRLQRSKEPGPIMVVGFLMLTVVGIACWQVLNPGGLRVDPSYRLR